MTRIFQALFVSAVVIAASVSVSLGATTIKVGHAQPVTDSMHLEWEFFKEQIEKRSNGELLVKIHPNGTLGYDRELIEAVQMGELPMTSVTNSPFASFVPDFYILDVPFAFSSRKEVWDALDGELGDHLKKQMLDKGLVALGFGENGFRNITNNKRPIRTPEDLRGVKLRTMENPIHLAVWKELGANPTPMSYGEIFTALQQGTIDGQENPFGQIWHMKFYEVQKYLSTTQHLYSIYINFMNKEYFDALSPEHQKLVLEVGREQALYQRKTAERLSNEAGEHIRAAGKTAFLELTDEERKAFRKSSSTALKLAKERVSPQAAEIFTKLTGIK